MTAAKGSKKPTTRGRRGEGSIYQRGRRWVGAVSLGYKTLPSGKRVRDRRTVTAATEKEAGDKKRALQALVDTGVPIPDSAERVGSFLRYWLAIRAREVGPRSLARYVSNVTAHLEPLLGRHKLSALAPIHIQGLIGALQDRGLSATSVRQILVVLSIALDKAVLLEMVPRNVARLVAWPKAGRYKPRPLGPDAARLLLAQIEDHPLEALWWVFISTGLRHGEAFGLRWQDLDLAAGTMDVRLALVRHKAGADLSRVDNPIILTPTAYLARPKTEASVARLTLPSVTVAALIRHRERQAFQRAAAGAEWHDHGLVFTTARGEPMHDARTRRNLAKLLAAAGLPPMRVHDLRHTCAVLMIEHGGEDALKAAQMQMRHQSIKTTLDTYGHVGPELQERAAGKMDALLRDLRTPKTGR